MTLIVCPPQQLDSAGLEAVESFADFLRFAPPPILTRQETQEQYRERIGTTRWVAWWFVVRNDPGLRSYLDGGPWL